MDHIFIILAVLFEVFYFCGYDSSILWAINSSGCALCDCTVGGPRGEMIRGGVLDSLE